MTESLSFHVHAASNRKEASPLQRKKKKGGKNAREREKTTPKSFSVGREREREECCGFIERESTHTQNKKRRGGKV